MKFFKCISIQIPFFFFICGITIIAHSQEPDTVHNVKKNNDTLNSLDEIVVTATRTNRLISQTPASVSIISRGDIDISSAKNIDDLIMSETGVQVKRAVGIGEGIPSDIIIRGIPGPFGSSRTLILVDGIPTNANGTPFLILNEIPLEAIKSIEIVRGPYSSLYGANAFGGVVNILTHNEYGKPEFNAYMETTYPFTVLNSYYEEERSMKTSLKKSGGETYWNFEGFSKGGNDSFHYLVSTGYRTIGNYLLRDYAITKNGEDTVHKSSENHDYYDFRFFGKSGITFPNGLDLEIHGRYFNSELGFGKTKNIIPDSVSIITRGNKKVIGALARYHFDNMNTMTLQAHYRTLTGEFWGEEPLPDTTYAPSYWKSKQRDFRFEARGGIKAGKAQFIIVGVEAIRNAIHFGEKKNTRTDLPIPGSYDSKDAIYNSAIFFQDEIQLFEKLNIVPGFRIDYHSIFKAEFSPKLGISYKIVDWLRVRTSAGRAFRAPTLSELYMPPLTIRPGFLLKANNTLDPEYIWAIDVGIEVLPVQTLKMSFGGFFNAMKDLITPTVDMSDLNDLGVTHANISSAWSRGLECDMEWYVRDWFTLFGNYVFQVTRNEQAGNTRKIFKDVKNYLKEDFKVPLDYVPRQTSDFGFRIHKKIGDFLLEGSVIESFVGKREYLEWTQIDVKTDFMVVPGEKELIVYIDPPLIHLDSYWKTDIGLKCTYKNHVWISFHIQNLLDEIFEESGGTLAPGRFASIKIGGTW